MHPEEREALDYAYFNSVEENRDGYEIEHRIIRKPPGAVRFVHETCRHVRTVSGAIVRSVGMVQDITEQKLAEQALLKSEERLKLIIRGSNDAPWDWDLETNDLYYSPQWWVMLGYELDELPADAGLWKRTTHPDNREMVDKIFD